MGAGGSAFLPCAPPTPPPWILGDSHSLICEPCPTGTLTRVPSLATCIRPGSASRWIALSYCRPADHCVIPETVPFCWSHKGSGPQHRPQAFPVLRGAASEAPFEVGISPPMVFVPLSLGPGLPGLGLFAHICVASVTACAISLLEKEGKDGDRPVLFPRWAPGKESCLLVPPHPLPLGDLETSPVSSPQAGWLWATLLSIRGQLAQTLRVCQPAPWQMQARRAHKHCHLCCPPPCAPRPHSALMS